MNYNGKIVKEKNMKSATYKEAGVDITKGSESVTRIKAYIKPTLNSSVLASIGSFGAVYDLKTIINEYDNPVLVQSIDSVGTKLLIANMVGNHSTIGVDMVAHSCNDILCQGAKPITFLDYIAVDKLKPEHIEEVVKGLCLASKEVDMPVIGGEIAELPGVYKTGEYDLVGSVTGVVDRKRIISGKTIKQGDLIIGLESNGLHTNGYSLARHVFFHKKKFSTDTYINELGCSLGEELLKPHMNYVPSVLPLLNKCKIKGIAHITGGGLQGNLSRVIPVRCQAKIKQDSWDILPIFKLIQAEGNVPDEDMEKTFNCGIGLVLVVNESDITSVVTHFDECKIKSFVIGEIVDRLLQN